MVLRAGCAPSCVSDSLLSVPGSLWPDPVSGSLWSSGPDVRRPVCQTGFCIKRDHITLNLNLLIMPPRLTHFVQFSLASLTRLTSNFSLCRQVSAFSTWEKELHKIVFDPRYLLLTSRERKQVFDKYVKERAEEERREKRNKMRETKEEFRKLLADADLSGK